MKITSVRVRRLRCPLDPPFFAAWDPKPRTSFEATLVLVETDEGLVGVGSGDTMDGFARYEDLFVGEDALALERHVRVLETIAFHAGRYWPLEAALWDLAGKAEGVPVARLLGGKADRIPAYASTGEARSAAERVESALALGEQGYRALKLRIDRNRLAEGLEAVASTREAVGESMEILVDLNQGWLTPGDLSPPLGYEEVRRTGERLAELDVFWFEEPLPREDLDGHVRLRADTGLRIAGGEMARTPAELEAFLAAGALDVFQHDAVLAVGVLRGRELAERALPRVAGSRRTRGRTGSGCS